MNSEASDTSAAKSFRPRWTECPWIIYSEDNILVQYHTAIDIKEVGEKIFSHIYYNIV